MENEFKVRAFHNNELPLVLKILKESAQNLREKGVDQWGVWLDPTPERLTWVMDGFNSGEFYALETAGGDIAGMYRLSMKDDLYWGEQEMSAGYLHSLTVRTAFAGRQLGPLMIKHIEKLLLGMQINLLRLDCVASNRKLCGFYENQGFEKVGEKLMPHSLNNLYEKLLKLK